MQIISYLTAIPVISIMLSAIIAHRYCTVRGGKQEEDTITHNAFSMFFMLYYFSNAIHIMLFSYIYHRIKMSSKYISSVSNCSTSRNVMLLGKSALLYMPIGFIRTQNILSIEKESGLYVPPFL